jgi:hypothetical protein
VTRRRHFDSAGILRCNIVVPRNDGARDAHGTSRYTTHGRKVYAAQGRHGGAEALDGRILAMLEPKLGEEGLIGANP